jgi:Ni/Co efflux regulator RcnB
MKKVLFVLAFVASIATVSAQTQEPAQEPKKEACCKKMAERKEGSEIQRALF